MPCRRIVLVSLLVACTAAAAQKAPEPVSPRPTSDSWQGAPAAAGSSAYRAATGVRQDAGEATTHFRFKEHRHWEPSSNPAQVHSGKAPISGSSLIGADGRPPVDCIRTPMDSACR